VNTRVGYIGGENKRPTYESVCAGDGHTEAIQIEYDPLEISYDALLDAFYNGHRPSRGKAQYKSAVWYHDEQQKERLEALLGPSLAVIDVEPAKAAAQDGADWHDAEEYHQKYYKKQGCSVM